MTAPILKPSDENIRRAAACLKAGGLVAMPTETVYGLAADASNGGAIARIYAVKGRPSFNPLIAHVNDLTAAQLEGRFSSHALRLAAAYWPGPLTQVVDLAETQITCDLARAGLDSIALRCPAHPVAQALLTAFGGPLVAPSANPSGQISPTTAEHVAHDLGEKIDLILDGGPCTQGIESTIVDARAETPVLLRPGSLAATEIDAIWPGLVRPSHGQNAPRSPGQLLRHYAPNALLRLNADDVRPSETLLGFGSVTGAALNLSKMGNLQEAAANLFSMLRQLDQTATHIAISPIPNSGLGEAINDRLKRAATR